MKKIFFTFLCIVCFKVNAQQNTQSETIKLTLDTVLVIGVFPNPEKPDYNLQVTMAQVHFEIANQYSKNLTTPSDSTIGFEIQVYSIIEHKYVNLKLPDSHFEQIKEDKLQILKPGETLRRKGEAMFTVEVNNKYRIRLIFLLSKNNTGINDANSNWVEL